MLISSLRIKKKQKKKLSYKQNQTESEGFREKFCELFQNYFSCPLSLSLFPHATQLINHSVFIHSPLPLNKHSGPGVMHRLDPLSLGPGITPALYLLHTNLYYVFIAHGKCFLDKRFYHSRP